ncbi:MAG: peptidase S41, partial [Bacteroidales bacterium]|nr:peptidase S41 [Bacteroidales bacterium]
MKKRYIHIMSMLAALAGIFACEPKDPEVAELTKEEKEQRQAINIFAYNTMDTYYLWNEEIADSLATWKMLEDPIEKVKRVRYKDANGKDIDKWTVLTNDIESMISSTGGVSTTYGMDFKLFWYDSSQTAVCMVVTLTYPDSPAEKAGLKRGDVIMKIGGKGITGDNYSELLYDGFLYAKSCTLTDIDSKEYKMTAVEMYEDPILVRKVFDVGGKKVGYLFFNSFTLAACEGLIDAAKYFRSEGIESLILDMRYNGGGYVITETVLASLLAPEAEVKAGSVFETAVYNSTLAKAWGEDKANFSETYSYKYGDKEYSVDLTGANMGISH